MVPVKQLTIFLGVGYNSVTLLVWLITEHGNLVEDGLGFCLNQIETIISMEE